MCMLLQREADLVGILYLMQAGRYRFKVAASGGAAEPPDRVRRKAAAEAL